MTVEESCGALAPEGQGIIIFTGKRRLSAMCLALTLPTFVTLAGQVLLGTDPVISKPPSPCQQKRVIDRYRRRLAYSPRPFVTDGP